MNWFMRIIASLFGWRDIDDDIVLPVQPVIPPPNVLSTPETPIVNPAPPVVPKYLWDTPEQARHSVRVICDEQKLSFAEKNLITAVIQAESGFYNTAINKNRNFHNVVTSIDYGICQINTRFHIGEGKTFPSVEYVLQNPDKVVQWMIKMFRAGHLNWWIAFVNGSYKKYMP